MYHENTSQDTQKRTKLTQCSFDKIHCKHNCELYADFLCSSNKHSRQSDSPNVCLSWIKPHRATRNGVIIIIREYNIGLIMNYTVMQGIMRSYTRFIILFAFSLPCVVAHRFWESQWDCLNVFQSMHRSPPQYVTVHYNCIAKSCRDNNYQGNYQLKWIIRSGGIDVSLGTKRRKNYRR